MTDHCIDVLRYAMHNSNNMANYLLRKEAIWSIRHPNKVMFRPHQWRLIGNQVVPIGVAEYIMDLRWKLGRVRGLFVHPDLSETSKEFKTEYEGLK